MSQILILEARPERVTEFRLLLEPKYNLTFVPSVRQAVQTAKRRNFVLFISALHLPEPEHPDESVFDFLRAVKLDPKTKAVPFFVCCIRPSEITQSMADALLTAARALGADYFEMCKPGDLSGLQEHVRLHIETAKKARPNGS